jgi:hypothetical protein
VCVHSKRKIASLSLLSLSLSPFHLSLSLFHLANHFKRWPTPQPRV